MGNQFIGRRVAVGVGIEATPGTEVAPTDWIKHLTLDFQRKTTKVQNESALGRVEKVNESAVVEQWAEGSLEGKIGDTTIGYLLYGIFGALVTTDNADSNPIVKDHTFDISNSQTPKTLTLARKDPITDRRHGMCTLDSLELSGVAGEWIKVNASMKSKAGVTATNTVAYVDENEFILKHLVAKLAANVAGIAGATAIPVKSFKITMTRPATPFFAAGSNDPNVITTGAWEFTGELVLQYTDATYDDISYANTAQALSLVMSNTDVTIGASAKPTLALTAPKVRISEFEMSNDLDDVVEQTLGISGELDLTAGYLLRAVLTNVKASY